MKIIQIKTEIKKYQSITELPVDEEELIYQARNAAKNSYSPYSNFKVGAALILSNGKVITGNNQENAAYPSGLCAERTAIFWANAQFPDIPIIKMVITAIKNNELVENPITPCGACRQVMIETETRYQTPIKTILDGKSSIVVIENSSILLPLFFDRDLLITNH